MSKTKIVSKGYTLTVISWENDGDAYQTKSFTIEDRQLASAVTIMCQTLFKSINNGEGGIGNSFDDDEPEAIIIEYMKAHPELYPGKTLSDEEMVELCMHYNYIAMGNADYYSRVCQNVEVFYSAEDAYAEKIVFIDLRSCKKGDTLISSHGAVLEYISPTPYEHFTYLDHVVRYVKMPDGTEPVNSFGTRTHDGFAFATNRIPETDHDIVQIKYKK